MMLGVLIGFGIVGSIIAVGYLCARTNLLGDGAERVLSRTAFNLALPAFMFATLSRASLRTLIRPQILTIMVTTVTMMLVFTIIAAVARWGLQRALIGALASSYVNGANLGLPVATYVLGDAGIIPPVMLFQLVLVAPVTLTILDVFTGERSVAQRLLRPLANPVVIASVAGVVLSASGVHVPDVVLTPFELLGGAVVPLMLLAFGYSLRGQGRPFQHGSTVAIIVASVLKAGVAPGTAILVGHLVFHLSGAALFAPVLCAALPTAQNVYIYSQRYPQATALARDVVLLTLVAAMPMLMILALVLH